MDYKLAIYENSDTKLQSNIVSVNLKCPIYRSCNHESGGDQSRNIKGERL